jgi:hypothetical protein
VEYDPYLDFSRYRTWSWHEGVTPAMSPVTNKRIREAIESEQAARGLTRVDAHAALLVVYHAAQTTKIKIDTLSYRASSLNTGIAFFQKGTLVIDMLDSAWGRSSGAAKPRRS